MISVRADIPPARRLLNDGNGLFFLSVCNGDRAGARRFKSRIFFHDDREPVRADAAAAVVEQVQVFGQRLIDADGERKRLEKQRDERPAGVKGSESKLSNENFVKRAKPEVVEQTKQRLAELKEQLAAVEKNLAELK